MVFYRYMRSHWFETLRDGCFKMANVRDFNDPFDGRGHCVGRLSREVIRNITIEEEKVWGALLDSCDKNIPGFSDKLLDKIAKVYSTGFYRSVQDRSMVDVIMYVLCFSACRDNDPAQRLMWAHYANGYRGVRIGVRFDDPNFPLYLDSVKYCHERPVLDLSKVRSLCNDPEFFNFWRSNLTTKSTEWAYEQEVRLIADDLHLERGKDDGGKDAYFWRFAAQDIVSVDVGCLVPSAEIDKLVELRNSHYPCMTIRQVAINDADYGISYKQLA